MIPSGETKRVLLPHQVDSSHSSDGRYRWPFSIPPPLTTSFVGSYSGGHSSLGHHSYDRNSDPEYKLVVTMHRRGLFARHIEFVPFILLSECYSPGTSGFLRLRQQICYVAPPDPSISSCSPSVSLDHPPSPLMDTSWPQQKFPPVMVRGVMFSEHDVEVECKVSNSSRIKHLLCLTFFSAHRTCMWLLFSAFVCSYASLRLRTR